MFVLGGSCQGPVQQPPLAGLFHLYLLTIEITTCLEKRFSWGAFYHFIRFLKFSKYNSEPVLEHLSREGTGKDKNIINHRIVGRDPQKYHKTSVYEAH